MRGVRIRMFSRLFLYQNQKILGTYSNRKGVVYAEPEGTNHLAHVIWKNPLTGKDSNIDYFLVRELKLKPNETRLVYKLPDRSAEDKFRLRYKILSDVKELEGVARDIASEDVNSFLKARIGTNENKAKRLSNYLNKRQKGKMQLKIVKNIRGDKNVRFWEHAAIQTIGKQDYYPGCLLDLNLDFARWCISGITPNGKLAPWNSCEYCYASHMHSGYPDAFAVEKANLIEQIRCARKERETQGKPTRYLRLGKRTECGAKVFRENLINTLEACVDEGIKCIFPTKFLEFDRDIARLLKRSDSSLLVSLGNDRFEPGAVLHGRTQGARIEDGLQYLRAGVRTIPYVLVDATLPYGGKHFESNLKRAWKEFSKIQILPIRLRHVERAKKILGGWHSVIREQEGQLNLFGENENGGYEVGNDGTRIAVDIDPSLSQIVGDNDGITRMCHHNSSMEYCGGCFMSGERGFARSSS